MKGLLTNRKAFRVVAVVESSNVLAKISQSLAPSYSQKGSLRRQGKSDDSIGRKHSSEAGTVRVHL